jgi:hypothetical protein
MNDGTLKVEKVTSITAAQPQAVAKFSITAIIDGFPVTISVEGKADALRAMIDRLKAIGATPPVSTTVDKAPADNSDAPVCEFHGKMKKGNYGWFCPKKMGDGSFCKSRG